MNESNAEVQQATGTKLPKILKGWEWLFQLPEAESQNKNGKMITRRQFLSLSGILSAALASCTTFPQNTADSPQAIENAPFLFRKDTVTQPGIEIISNLDGSPFSKDQFNEWSAQVRQTGEYLSDPAIRTTAILIGRKAWEKWNSEGILDGEKILPYLKRITDKFNRVFSEKTRPESGIKSLRFKPIVAVVDEDWIANAGDYERQYNQADTFGRWSWDISGRLAYKPEAFLTENNRDPESGLMIDDKLCHELIHYSFYISPHLFNYFDPTSMNWNNLLEPNFGLGNKENLRVWINNPDDFQGLNGMQLQNLEFMWKNQYVMSKIEESYLNRVILSQEPQFKKYENTGSGEFFKDLFTNDLASSYSMRFDHSFIVPLQGESPVLYKGKLKELSFGDNATWKFDESCEKIPCSFDNERIYLPVEFMKGLVKMENGDEAGSPVPFILKIGDKMLGFTSFHLAYWHWREQIKQGEAKIGKFGNKFPVEVSVPEWFPFQ